MGIHPRRHGNYQSPTLTLLTWMYALAVRHLTLPGRVVLCCFAVLGPYALITLSMPAHLLSLGVGALFSVDVVVGWLFRPRVDVRRILPTRLAVGAQATATYEIAKRGKMPCWDIEVDSLPLPHSLRFSSGRWGLPHLRRGRVQRGTARLLATARGEFLLPAVRVSSGFPFHLFRFGTTAGNPQTLVIYPEFAPLARIVFPASVRYHAEGAPQSTVAGASLEFLGCREFREGDNLRHLHMRSWARTGVPVVKEFREEYFCRLGLVLDPTLERHPFEEIRRHFSPRIEFEAMVSLAAAITDHFASRDYAVDLFAAGSRVYRFAGGRSFSVQDRILEILGSLDYTTTDRFDQLETALLEEPPDMSGVLFVVNIWNRARKRLVEELIANGIPCRVLIVHFRRALPAKTELPPYATRIAAESVKQGHCREL